MLINLPIGGSDPPVSRAACAGFSSRWAAMIGGLMSYGISLTDVYLQVGVYTGPGVVRLEMRQTACLRMLACWYMFGGGQREGGSPHARHEAP